MKRTPTNFGPYESEYRQRVSWGRRWVLILLQLALVTVGVVLAGFFLFPMGAAIDEDTGELLQQPFSSEGAAGDKQGAVPAAPAPALAPSSPATPMTPANPAPAPGPTPTAPTAPQ